MTQEGQDGAVAKASPIMFATGAVLLLVAAGASLMLVLQHLGGMSLPGCGPESACAALSRSVWGRVPLVNWPTAHVGLAYFTGLLVAWIVARGAAPMELRWVVRVGALLSVILTIVMIVLGHLCMYCLAVHLANIAFLVMLELRSPRPACTCLRPFVALGAVFLLASGGLVFAELRHQASVEEQAQGDLAQSTAEIIKGAGRGTTVVDPTGSESGFTGRWRLGPEEAPIRIVIISDYQCPDCRTIETQVRQLLETRDDVSFSAKHFPMCSACNSFCAKRNFNPHPNACWAARLAEAVGKLYGNDAFFKAHQWLFDREGLFKEADLRAGMAELGFDLGRVKAEMLSEQILEPVHADIDEAIGLGIYFTPMVFINGVQLRGWNARNALIKAVEEVAATNPPALTSAADNPPRAAEKYVGDWREKPVRNMPPDPQPWTTGATDAAVRVVVWGDYQEPNTLKLNTRVRKLLEERSDVSYTFRHYPFNQSCNPSLTVPTRHPLACRMAQAAEAAGRLGGQEAYWGMHEWIFANQRSFSDAGVREQATAMGLPASALITEMSGSGVATAITEDTQAAKRMGLRSIPFLFINERQVPRWDLAGEDIISLIAESAASE